MASHLQHPTPARSRRPLKPHRFSHTNKTTSQRSPFKSAPLHLSYDVKHKLNKAIQEAWKTTTLNKYNSSVQRFLTFCDKQNICTAFRLPASEIPSLCFRGLHHWRTIWWRYSRRDMSALQAWHIFYNAPWMGSTQLHYTIKGAKRILAPKTSKTSDAPSRLFTRNARYPIQ